MSTDFTLYIPFALIPLIGWGLVRYLKKKNDFTPLKKTALAIGIFAFYITELVRSFWRPYVQKHHIFDFYFSDTIGNSFGTITGIFIILTLSGTGTKKDWKLILAIILGLMVYEYMNPPSRFDIKDVYATLLFGLISSVVYLILLKKYRKNPTKTRNL